MRVRLLHTVSSSSLQSRPAGKAIAPLPNHVSSISGLLAVACRAKATLQKLGPTNMRNAIAAKRQERVRNCALALGLG
jgi:hypothetical protein